ncbi:MAG: Nif11-like leader peptide family natural product precursor [Prochlorococcus sp.]|jgi:hypothetical protein
MSRQDVLDFLHAAEHSASLRRELRQCSDQQSLLEVARRYGFSIKPEDLQNDSESERIETWFEASKISPVRRNLA